MNSSPKALPALHWPSFGKAMAFEGAGFVITALLLEWTAAVDGFDGQFFPWGWARLVPGFLVAWVLVTLPWMASSFVRERALGVGYLLPALVRAAITFAVAWQLAPEGTAWEALFILGCLGGVWLLSSIGIYSLFWREARKKGQLDEYQPQPIGPETLLFFAQAILLLLTAVLIFGLPIESGFSWVEMAGLMGIAGAAILLACVVFARLRWSGVRLGAPAALAITLVQIWLAVVASYAWIASHDPWVLQGGSWFTLLLLPVRVAPIVFVCAIPSVYLYLLLLRDPRPFAPALPRSGWAALTAFGAELLLLLALTDLTETRWLIDHGIGGLHAFYAVIPLLMAWLLVRVPAILLSDPRKGMSDWVWLGVCLLSSGFAPVVHDFMAGETAMLGTAYLQAAVASVVGAGLYRMDCRMRAQAGCED